MRLRDGRGTWGSGSGALSSLSQTPPGSKLRSDISSAEIRKHTLKGAVVRPCDPSPSRCEVWQASGSGGESGSESDRGLPALTRACFSLLPSSHPSSSSPAPPCRSLVSVPPPGLGHAPVHFRLLLWPPWLLQDEEEEGGSPQTAGNGCVNRTGAPSKAPQVPGPQAPASG